jgi:hypothetical protein
MVNGISMNRISQGYGSPPYEGRRKWWLDWMWMWVCRGGGSRSILSTFRLRCRRYELQTSPTYRTPYPKSISPLKLQSESPKITRRRIEKEIEWNRVDEIREGHYYRRFIPSFKVIGGVWPLIRKRTNFPNRPSLISHSL